MNKSAFVFPYGSMDIKVKNVATERRKKIQLVIHKYL